MLTHMQTIHCFIKRTNVLGECGHTCCAFAFLRPSFFVSRQCCLIKHTTLKAAHVLICLFYNSFALLHERNWFTLNNKLSISGREMLALMRMPMCSQWRCHPMPPSPQKRDCGSDDERVVVAASAQDLGCML